MSSQRTVFLNNPATQKIDAATHPPRSSINTITAKIYEEFTIVQLECYQKGVMLQAYEKQSVELNAQLHDMSWYIKAVEEQNWKLDKKMRAMEAEMESTRQASSCQGRGSQE